MALEKIDELIHDAKGKMEKKKNHHLKKHGGNPDVA